MNYNLLENGNNITRIDISFGEIKRMPILPLNLEILIADNNFSLESLSFIPPTLRVLSICLTGIQFLTSLPNTLEELYVSENPGILIDKLPMNLKIFVANCCELEELPVLPPRLLDLEVDGNYLEDLPTYLPPTIKTIIASNNQILRISTSIADLNNLSVLMIQNNVIRVLPPMPPYIKELNCAENNLKRLPSLPDSLISVVFFGNPLIYEFDHQRVSSKDYINKINRFVSFYYLSILRMRITDFVKKKKTPSQSTHDNWDAYSKRSFSLSSMSSFLTVSSVDPWFPSDSHEDEFVFI
jgi:Leucine-rich repeat (LRR) protein